jgi:glycosyltransferase involved in cell wall biosynthesis
MKILQIHNLYRSDSPSGENETVDLIAASLAALGEDVVKLRPSSDDLTSLSFAKYARAPFGGGPVRQRLREIVRHNDLDVALLHNVYPSLSPSIVTELGELGIPVVHVVHNYRHSCLNGAHWRAERNCIDCDPVQRWGRLPGVVHGCYRTSRAQSLALATAEHFGAQHWKRLAMLIHISEHMSRTSGTDRIMPRIPVTIIPDPVAESPPARAQREDFMYVGRLTEEKGIRVLLDAWQASRPDGRLHIVGDGPLRAEVDGVAKVDRSIVFHGRKSADEVRRMRTQVLVACVPALWGEPFGRVAAEAQSASQVVIASGTGALPEILSERTGVVVEPSVRGWVKGLTSLMNADVAGMSRRAHEKWSTTYRPEVVASCYRRALSQTIREQA